jgi:hypothetical protein
LCNTDNNLGYKIELTIWDKFGGWYDFSLGCDFSWGGAVFIDGVAENWNEGNMWWNGIWSTTDSFKFSKFLAPGTHTIIFYGADDKMNGPMNF